MKFSNEVPEVFTPSSAPDEAKQVAHRVDDATDGKVGSSTPSLLNFQPSAESLSIFDQAKRQCAKGAGVGARLGLRKELRPGREAGLEKMEEAVSRSTDRAAIYQPSSESLAIFDEAKRQCNNGDKTLNGLRSLNKKNNPSGPSTTTSLSSDKSGKMVTTRATAVPTDALQDSRSTAHTHIDKERLGDVGKRAVDSWSQKSIDAAKWCSLVRQHQAQAEYLNSRCRREFWREQERVRQPFTPRDRYRSPPRRSVASACWEGWCADEKVLASMREEVKAARQTNSEFSSGRRFADWFESARRRFGGAVSWLSTKIRAVWDGVYRLASWVDCFKI